MSGSTISSDPSTGIARGIAGYTGPLTSIITGTISVGVTLGVGSYASDLTITNTGKIDPANDVFNALYVPIMISSTVVNDGTIAAGPSLLAAIDATGALYLDNVGVILAASGGTGVQINSAGSVYNTGTIYSANIGSAVFLNGTASLLNKGLIDGVVTVDGAGSMTNLGRVDGGVLVEDGTNEGTIAGGGVALVLNGPTGNPETVQYSVEVNGSFTNTGTISGAATSGAAGGVFVNRVFTNQGVVLGGSETSAGSAGDVGVRFDGTSSANYGTITGGYGKSIGGAGVVDNVILGPIRNLGTIIGGGGGSFGGEGVFVQQNTFGLVGPLTDETLTFLNAGLIEGGLAADGTRADALQTDVPYGTFTLILDPGATFIGDVAASGILDLAGTGPGTLAGLGSSVTGFSTITFAPNAAWTVEGNAAGVADGEAISGFTLNDTIVLDGFAATSHTHVAGAGLELSNGAITETLNIASDFGTLAFDVIGGASATTIALTDDHTISNTVTTSVTLGSVTLGNIYLSPLTITATGAIAPTAARATALYAATGTVTNHGAITGGADTGVAGAENIGGIGVSLNAATLFNAGIITGGADLYPSGNHDAPMHAGGIGVSLASGTVTNSGDIIGGAGGSIIGVGGIAAVMTGGALANTGTLTGGAGGSGGGGGAGASFTNASLQNSGTIIGGSINPLGFTVFGGSGGNGVGVYGNAILSNAGAISGGRGENGTDALAGGAGAVVDGGTAANTGTITGGAGYHLAGAGAQLLAGDLSNAGAISGGLGSFFSGAGIVVTGGSFTNAIGGILAGGAGDNNGLGGEGGVGAFVTAGVVLNSGDILGGNIIAVGAVLAYAGAGVYLNGGTITNTAAIDGGNALPNPNGVVYGIAAAGAQIQSGQLTNTGTITGGSGTIGGEGATIAAGTISNLGLIIGGADYGVAGAGLIISGGVAIDSGTITGQSGGAVAGGAGPSGGAEGGAGVIMQGGSLSVSQSGTITGGYGGYGVSFGGAGGFGAYLSGGTLVNNGFIGGGTDGLEAGDTADSGQIGIVINGGTLLNFGSVAGGASHRGIFSSLGNTAVVLKYGSVSNAGAITGGFGGFVGGLGAAVYGGTFDNTGTLSSGLSGFGGGGGGADVTGGLLVNTGVIDGPNIAVGLGGGSVQNAGTISISAYGRAVALSGGVLSNLSTGLISGGSDANGVDVSGGTLINAGTIAAATQLAVDFTAPALLIVDPGASFIGGVDGSGTLELASAGTAGTLDLGGSFSGFTTIAFQSGAHWSLAGSTDELAGSQEILGFSSGDTLNVQHFHAVTETFVPGIGLELFDNQLTETIDLIGNFSTSSFIVNYTGGNTEIELCYLRGTRILTPAGEVPIETLNIGDAVITRYNGYRRIKWIGRQSFGRRFIQTNRAQRPIRFAAGAFGPQLPKRDLYVAPGHSMLIGNVLVLASNLINGVTITQSDCPEEVHYYQLEFESHDCVQAEGCWSESFCDYADLRSQFHNVADFYKLYPDHVTPAAHLMCAPRPEHGPLLEEALRPIAARAAAPVPPGPLQGWIDHIDTSGMITGWAQDTVHPELPVLVEILLQNQSLGTTLACDHRADLAAAGIGQGRAGFAFRSPNKIGRGICSTVQVRRVTDGATLPLAPHCHTERGLASKPRRKRA